jgi:hypothetical protein
LVEGGRHRLDGLEEGTDLLQLVAVEHLGGLGGVVEVAAEDVPIWVVEPMGLARPRRIASTPAMRVVATAPMPGIMMPSFPVAGLMLAA